MLYRIVFFTLCILFSQIGFANEVVVLNYPLTYHHSPYTKMLML